MKIHIKIIFFILTLTLYSIISSNTYAQLVPDFRVNDDTTTARSQYSSQLSGDRFGNFTVVWQDQRNNRPNVYAQRFDYNANFLGVNFRVNVNPDSSFSPGISVSKNGNFTICWLEVNNNIPNGSKMKCRLFKYDSTPLTSEILLNDSNINLGGMPSISVNSRDEFIITWEQNGIRYQKIDSIGNKIGINVKVNDYTGFSGTGYPDITVRQNDSFIITWSDTRPPSGGNADDIYYQIFDQFGNRIGVNQKVNDDFSTLNLQYLSRISVDTSGNFIIAWNDDRLDNSHNEVYAQRYSSNGDKLGINYRVTEGSFSNTKSICNVSKKPNGDFLIGWSEYRSSTMPYFKKYSYLGIAIGSNFLISHEIPSSNKNYRDFFIFEDKIISIWDDTRNGPFDVYCNIRSFSNPDTTVNIIQTSSFIPENFTLFQNYPNPFNPTTLISFDIKQSDIYKFEIINNLGQSVKEIFHKSFNPGTYQFNFEATNLSSGIYYYILSSPKERFVKSFVLLK